MTKRKAAAALVLMLSFLSFCTPSHADPAADALVKQVENASASLQSASGNIIVTTSSSFAASSSMPDNLIGIFRYLRPSRIREEDWDTSLTGQKQWAHRFTIPHYIAAADGSAYWALRPDGSTLTGKVDSSGVNPSNFGSMDFSSILCDGSAMLKQFSGTRETVGIDRVWNGIKYKVIDFAIDNQSGGNAQPPTMHGYFLVGPDFLIHRLDLDAGSMGKADIAITNVRINIRLSKSEFNFKPPSWAKLASNQTDGTSGDVAIDPAAKRIFARVNAEMKSIHSLTAQCTDTFYVRIFNDNKVSWNKTNDFGTLKLFRPNYMLLEMCAKFSGSHSKASERKLPKIIASNGTTVWNLWDPVGKFYESSPVKPDGSNIPFIYSSLLGSSFFCGAPFEQNLTDDWTKGYIFYAGLSTWHGAKYQLIEADLINADSLDSVQSILVGKDDLVHESYEMTRNKTGIAIYRERTLTNIRVNPPLSKSDFAYAPPAGATEKTEFPDTSTPSPPLLAKGSVAPDFTVYDSSGNPIKLSDFHGKVVVLDFWATWCGPCQMSLPNTNALAARLAGQNVQFLAVNVWDTKEAFDSWLPQHKQYSSLKFAIDTTPGQGDDIATKQYNVSGIPTQFVIDPNGKVVNSFVGYDPDTSAFAAAIKTAERTAN